MPDSEDSDDEGDMSRWGRWRREERIRNKSPKPYSLMIQELIKQQEIKKEGPERHAREITTQSDDAGSGQKSVAKDAAADDVSNESNSALNALLQTPQLAGELTAFDTCGFTLRWMAREGCAPAITSLLDHAPDPTALIEAPDGMGRTALSWAAGEGHVAALSWLLERGASLTAEDLCGRTPLAWAAANGHENTAGLLLDYYMHFKDGGRVGDDEDGSRDGDTGDAAATVAADAGYVDSPCAQGRSPLSWAAGNGHEGVVRLLLAQGGAVMDLEDVHGARPLAWAAAGGHELAVLRLFQQVEEVAEDEKAKKPEYMRKFTTLYWARSRARGEEILPVLARHGLDLNAQDHRGRTALEMAAAAGCVAVATILLEHGADADNQNAVGRTPLMEAAIRGHYQVVRLLLSKEEGGGKADPGFEDEDGETALSLAIYAGHDAVVRLLSEAVNRDPFQKSERESLLWWALKHSSGDAMAPLVRALVEDGIDPNAPGDKDGQHPLLWAAASGHEAIVAALLGAEGVNLEHQDEWNTWLDKNKTHDWGSGLTPLGWAARNGHGGIAARLLARGAVVEAKDKSGLTPLGRAAGGGHSDVVELLLQHSAGLHLFEMRTSPIRSWSDRHQDKHTPLREAVANGHWDTARMLVERAVDDVCARLEAPPPTPATDYYGYAINCLVYWDGRSELSWAAQVGHVEAVRRLLLLPTTLSPWPSSSMLPSASEFAVDSRDSSRRTPLLMAAKEGHVAVVELLLSNGASASAADSGRRTPLWEAAANGHAAVVGQLLKRCKASHLGAADEHEKNTPLHKAAQGGHVQVARLLLDYAADKGDDIKRRNGSGEPMEDGNAENDDDSARSTGEETGIDSHGKKKPLMEAENKDCVRPLGMAAAEGHGAMVKMLLVRGADIEAQGGWSSMTALDWAAKEGRVDIVDVLLKHGASADPADRSGGSGGSGGARVGPLGRAAAGGHLGVVELLLTRPGADPNWSADPDDTPLCKAAEAGSEAVVRRLLVAGARHLGLALEKAAQKGHAAVVKVLVGKGASPEPASNRRSDSYYYYKVPLLAAAESGNAPIVRMLLDQGAGSPTLGGAAAGDRQHALFLAAGSGHASVIKLLVAQGGSAAHLVNARDDRGWTPLIHAARSHRNRWRGSGDSIAAARILLVAGADCNAVTDKGSTALCECLREKRDFRDHDATATPQAEIVKLLLAAGADPDLGRDPVTRGTALVLAVKGGHGIVVVEMLIAAGADVEARDKKGMTPLLLTAVDGDVEVIQALVEKGGAHLEAEDRKRRTALSWAGWNKHKKAAKLLLEKGANESAFIGRRPPRSQWPTVSSFNRSRAYRASVSDSDSDSE